MPRIHMLIFFGDLDRMSKLTLFELGKQIIKESLRQNMKHDMKDFTLQDSKYVHKAASFGVTNGVSIGFSSPTIWPVSITSFLSLKSFSVCSIMISWPKSRSWKSSGLMSCLIKILVSKSKIISDTSSTRILAIDGQPLSSIFSSARQLLKTNSANMTTQDLANKSTIFPIALPKNDSWHANFSQ